MIDITHKSFTLRTAIAQSVVKVSKEETINAIVQKTVPKGDVFETARAAGLLATKHTYQVIPDCHPIPIESVSVNYEIKNLEIHIKVEVKTIYKTGVEVEAMHGASIVALTIYDMLKPIDKEIEIKSVKLLKKSGGKSDFTDSFSGTIDTVVIVSSDSVSKGKKQDSAGKAIIDKLKSFKVIAVKNYLVIPDEPEQLQRKVEDYCKEGIKLIIITGGTGLSNRDKTPEALKPILDQEIPGIMETARSYGQLRTPYAMLSRGVAGFKGNTLIIAVPGSTKGAVETLDALFPAILHVFKVQEHEYRHKDAVKISV